LQATLLYRSIQGLCRGFFELRPNPRTTAKELCPCPGQFGCVAKSCSQATPMDRECACAPSGFRKAPIVLTACSVSWSAVAGAKFADDRLTKRLGSILLITLCQHTRIISADRYRRRV